MTIDPRLHCIVAVQSYPLLFATISGAHLYRVTSPDSDFHETEIQQLHRCDSKHVESVPVHVVFHGQTVWPDDVEVFDLTGHPKAKRCYRWTHGEPEEFITILGLPPVTDAQYAVTVGVSYQIKKAW